MSRRANRVKETAALKKQSPVQIWIKIDPLFQNVRFLVRQVNIHVKESNIFAMETSKQFPYAHFITMLVSQ